MRGASGLAHSLAASRDATPARALALSAASKLAAHHGDDEAARAAGDEYLHLPESVRERAWTADVLAGLAIVANRSGDVETAYRYGLEAVALAQSIGDPVDAAIYRTYAATAAYLARSTGRSGRAVRTESGRSASARLPVGRGAGARRARDRRAGVSMTWPVRGAGTRKR